MSNKCGFVTKNMTKESKQDIVKALEKIRADYSNKFKKGMNFGLVGSAKRNLVFQKGSSDWDMDWQIFIDKNKLEESLGSTRRIKEWFIDELKKHISNKYTIENSTSVITLNKDPRDGNGFKSYDIAILAIDKNTGLMNFIKFDKDNQKYIWNELPNSENRHEKVKNIKGSEMWGTFRDFYKEKKCINFEKNDKDKTKKTSLQIYWDAVNHTLQVYNISI